MRDYRKYDVWQKAHELTLFVSKEVLPKFPTSERFELASKIKRATYSIAINIAEGCGRNSEKGFLHFWTWLWVQYMKLNIAVCC